MELAIIKKEVLVVEMQNKPLMAVALENPKIRDYPEEIRNANTFKMVDWLLNLLGVNDKNATEHHTVLINQINQVYSNYTYQEIKLAFEMYVQGKYMQNNKPMLVTQQLNTVVFGKVMREYELIKKTELDAYYQKRNKISTPETSEEEKKRLVEEGVENCFKEFKKTGKVLPGYRWVYDHLDEQGEIKFSKEEKKKKMVYAQKKLQIEARESKNHYEIKGILKGLEDIKSSPVINEAKRLLLEDYFRSKQTKV